MEDQLGKDAGILSEEQMSERDLESYGRDRVEQVVIKNFHEPPQSIVDRIFDDIDLFRGGTPLTDDQTIIALRVL